MNFKGKMTIVSLILLYFTTNQLMGQNLNRLSVNLHGGTTWGHTSVESAPGYVFGGGLEFGATSALAFNADVRAGLLTSDDQYNRNYENKFFQVGFGGIFYLKDAFDIQNGVVNPFAKFGGGIIVSDVTPLDEHHFSRTYDGQDVYITVGGGVKLKLNNRIDLLAQVDLAHAYTDFIDGYNDPTRRHTNDFFSTYQAGIAIKLGGASEHITWYEPEDPAIQMINQTNNDVRELKKTIAEQEGDTEAMKELREEFNSFKSEVNRRMNEIARGQDTMARAVRERRPVEQDRTTRERTDRGTRDIAGVERGTYYIIGGSFQNSSNAESLRERYRSEGYEATIIHDPNVGLYRVSIESHTKSNDAKNRLNHIRQNVENNAWLLVP